jgi:hypothetical protein
LSEKATLSSSEATEAEKALIHDLHPWPISNERAWAIAHKHMGDSELGLRIYRREAHDYEVKLCGIRRYLESLPVTRATDDIVKDIFLVLDAESRNPEEGA